MIFAIFGLVLLGFGLFSIPTFDPWLILGQMLPGLGLLVYAAVTSYADLRERVSGQAGRRNLWFGSNAVVQGAALAAVLAVVAYVAQRSPVHWDWTESGIHGLSKASLQVLEQIPKDQSVEIYAFYQSPDTVREALSAYDYASDRLSYRILDANRSPLLAQQLEVTEDKVMVVCAGPCVTKETDGTQRVAKATAKTTELSEQKITEAIRSVVSKRHKVYFVIGHDESDPDSQDDAGLSQVASALGGENIEYATLLLAQTEKVPDDADAVALVAPSQKIYDREIQALDAYLKKGGSVLVLADALRGSNVADLLRAWSIELGNDLVVDQQLQLFGPPVMTLEPVVSDYGDHPITKDMRRRLTFFRMARSVQPASGAEGDVTVLATTGPESYAVSDKGVTAGGEVKLDPSKDRKGPIPLAVARTFKRDDAPPPEATPEGHPALPKLREGRLVVAGDADFAQNRYVSEAANADLFLNMVTWLVGDESFITVDRKLPRASRVAMSEANLKLFSYLGLFLVPEGVLMLGIWNWWRRRQF